MLLMHLQKKFHSLCHPTPIPLFPHHNSCYHHCLIQTVSHPMNPNFLLKCEKLLYHQLHHCSRCAVPCTCTAALLHAHNLTWLQNSERLVSIFLVITRNMKKLIVTWSHAPHGRLNGIMTTLSCTLAQNCFNIMYRWLKHNWNVFICDTCGCGSSGDINISEVMGTRAGERCCPNEPALPAPT